MNEYDFIWLGSLCIILRVLYSYTPRGNRK